MKWWYSSCKDGPYSGPYDTREEALVEADTDYTVYVLQAEQKPIRLADYFVAEDWLARVDENDFEEMKNEDGDSLVDHISCESLEMVIRNAIDDWQDQNGVIVIPWTFTKQTPAEKVEPDDRF